jgi:hypothetical protein
LELHATHPHISPAQQLGWKAIPAVVLAENDEDPEKAYKEDSLWALSENIHRVELTAIRRAEHFDCRCGLLGESDAGDSQPESLEQVSSAQIP